MTRYDVLFIGGGYATLMTAARLSRAGLRLAVADPRPHFTHRVRLHEVAAGRGTGAVPWSEVLPPGVAHLPHYASHVGPGGARLEGLGEVEAEQVVIATGSRSRALWSGPSVAPMETAADAQAIHRRLQAPSARTIAVIGAGATGLELATALAEARPQSAVTLIDARGVTGMSEDGAARVRARLSDLQVRLVRAQVQAVDAEAVHTTGGAVPADLVLPCPGFEAPGLARDSGLPVNAKGQVQVDDSLQVIGHPGVFAAGDAAYLPSQAHVGMGCASAMPMGAHLASTLLRLRRDETPLPFEYAWVLQQVALGRRHGIVQGLRWDGAPTWVASGRWVGWAKEALNRGILAAPRWERRLGRPLYAWSGPPQGAALLEAQ